MKDFPKSYKWKISFRFEILFENKQMYSSKSCKTRHASKLKNGKAFDFTENINPSKLKILFQVKIKVVKLKCSCIQII